MEFLLRYSIWLDSKLRLQLDPLLILEYFLWRKGYEYAISNHYDRHCVWEEVAQNKKLNKYNHTVIDQQFAFYQADGLKKFNPSDPKRLLPSSMTFFGNFLTFKLADCMYSFHLTHAHTHILHTCASTHIRTHALVICSLDRCTGRIFHCEGTYPNVELILLPLVQWSWSVYSSWSA